MACHSEKCHFGRRLLAGLALLPPYAAWTPLGTAGLASETLAARPGALERRVPEAAGLGPVPLCAFSIACSTGHLGVMGPSRLWSDKPWTWPVD